MIAAPPYRPAATSTSAGAGTQASSSLVGVEAASDGAQLVSNARGDITEQSWPWRCWRPSTCPSSCAATQTDSGRGEPVRFERSRISELPSRGRPIEVL